MASKKFLVTGASGYIALHVVDQLLKAGHTVRGTVRSLQDEVKVGPIKKLAANAKHPLELVETDLLKPDSWHKAMQDIDIVLHLASPFVMDPKVPDDAIIKPAVDGTLNVLNAAANAGVRRVVVTSSGISIFGHDYEQRLYSEKDWPDVDKIPYAYGKSKVLAERAAWDFVEQRRLDKKPCFELATVHPVFVLGPLLSTVTGESATRFLNVFRNKIEKVPNYYLPTCDVRDVAQAHIRAALLPEAAGQRHIITSSRDWISMKEWADILRAEFTSKGYRIPSESDPNDPGTPGIKMDDTRMRQVLGITPRPFKSTIIDMAKSMIEHDLK